MWSLTELKEFDISSLPLGISSFIALFALLLWISLVLGALYYFIKHFKAYTPEQQFLFMEFYRGMKPNKWARLYTTNLLTRRFIFVVLMVWAGGESVNWLFWVLILLQSMYLICFIVLRPYENISQNIVEVINEFILLALFIVAWALGKEDDWTHTSTEVFIWLMTASSLILVLILWSRSSNSF